MADAATSSVIQGDTRIHRIFLSSVSDGTGESAVVKVDKSALLANDGAAPSAITILAVEYNIQGFTSVALAWDHTTDDVALTLGPGTGGFNFTGYDDIGDPGTAARFNSGLNDPASAGGTGDIVLTTAGNTSGDSYAILLTCLLRP